MSYFYPYIDSKRALLNDLAKSLGYKYDTIKVERIVNTMFRAVKRRLSEQQWRSLLHVLPSGLSSELPFINSPSQPLPFKDYQDLMQAIVQEDKQTERHDFSYAEEIDRAIQVVFKFDQQFLPPTIFLSTEKNQFKTYTPKTRRYNEIQK